jgi:hypothetical protein
MLHAGLDLSRRRVDVCLLDEAGEVVAETAAPPDADGLRGLARRLGGQRVPAVIESMTGARFVHDTLEEHGWEVLVAVAQKVKGLAPLRARPTRSTRGREAVGCLGADVAFALGDAGASTSSRRSLSQCANRGSATTRSDRRRGLLLGGRSDSARNAATALATRTRP